MPTTLDQNGASQDSQLHASLPKQGDPNIDTKILYLFLGIQNCILLILISLLYPKSPFHVPSVFPHDSPLLG